MHIKRSRSDSYIGGHSVIQLSRRQVEQRLIVGAEEAKRARRKAQASFDAAAAAYKKSCERLIRTAEQDAEMKRNWHRVQEAVHLLRRECAYYRMRAKKAEQALAKLTAETK